MLSDRLYVNDVEVELSPGTLIALNFQINNLGDLSDRQADFSQTFKIPKTTANAVIFEQAGLIQSQTVLPYRRNRCRVNRRGIDIVNDGVLILEEVADVYSCTVYSGNYNFADLLGDKKLSDLNLRQYDIPVILANIYNSRANTYLDGVIFGVADYNDDPAYMGATNPIFKANRSLPQIFIKTLFLKIMAEAGISVSGAWLSSAFFESLLLQLYNSQRGGVVYQSPIFASSNEPTTGNIKGNTAYLKTSFFPPVDDLRAQLNEVWPGDVTTHPEYNCILLLNTTEIAFTAEVEFNAYNNTASPITFYVAIYKHTNGFYPGTPLGRSVFTIGPGQTWATQKVIVKSDEGVAITIGQNVYLKIDGLSMFNAGTYDAKVNVTGGFVTGYMVNGYVPVINNTFNQYAIVKYGVPDMKQYDLVKAVLQLGALFIRSDNLTKITEFRQLNEIKAAEITAKDWTSKLSAGGGKLSFRQGSYYQNNWLRYAKDDAVYPPDLGDGSFAIDDKTLDANNTEPTANLIELPFAASQMVVRLGGAVKQKFVPLIKSWDATGNFIPTTPRLLLLTREPAVVGELKQVTDGTTTNTYSDVLPLCKFIDPTPGSTGNLGFGNDLLKTNYPELVVILNKFKLVEERFKLDDLDIYNLDFFTPIYLAQYSAYFYINLVKNYTGEGLTAVELIRI